jgi:hypothetical protein
VSALDDSGDQARSRFAPQRWCSGSYYECAPFGRWFQGASHQLDKTVLLKTIQYKSDGGIGTLQDFADISERSWMA